MKKYELFEKIGDGAYGSVWKAKDKSSSEFVAVKKLKRRCKDFKELYNLTEVKTLYFLNRKKCENIVSLQNVVMETDGTTYIILNYSEQCLRDLIENNEKHKVLFEEDTIKKIVYQISLGINFIHSMGFFHRDIKPDNVLIGEHSIVKITDFGFATKNREFNFDKNKGFITSSNKYYNTKIANIQILNSRLSNNYYHLFNTEANNVNTNIYQNSYFNANSASTVTFDKSCEKPNNTKLTDYMCSRYYRPPECLFKSDSYGVEIDIWALGTLVAEMYLSRPLFEAESDVELFFKFCEILGTPSREDFILGYEKLDAMTLEVKHFPKIDLMDFIPNITEEAVDLLKKILVWNPKKRANITYILQHKYFEEIKDRKIYTQLGLAKRYLKSKNNLDFITNRKNNILLNNAKISLNHKNISSKKEIFKSIKKNKNLNSPIITTDLVEASLKIDELTTYNTKVITNIQDNTFKNQKIENHNQNSFHKDKIVINDVNLINDNNNNYLNKYDSNIKYNREFPKADSAKQNIKIDRNNIIEKEFDLEQLKNNFLKKSDQLNLDYNNQTSVKLSSPKNLNKNNIKRFNLYSAQNSYIDCEDINNNKTNTMRRNFKINLNNKLLIKNNHYQNINRKFDSKNYLNTIGNYKLIPNSVKNQHDPNPIIKYNLKVITTPKITKTANNNVEKSVNSIIESVISDHSDNSHNMSVLSENDNEDELSPNFDYNFNSQHCPHDKKTMQKYTCKINIANTKSPRLLPIVVNRPVETFKGNFLNDFHKNFLRHSSIDHLKSKYFNDQAQLNPEKNFNIYSLLNNNLNNNANTHSGTTNYNNLFTFNENEEKKQDEKINQKLPLLVTPLVKKEMNTENSKMNHPTDRTDKSKPLEFLKIQEQKYLNPISLKYVDNMNKNQLKFIELNNKKIQNTLLDQQMQDTLTNRQIKQVNDFLCKSSNNIYSASTSAEINTNSIKEKEDIGNLHTEAENILQQKMSIIKYKEKSERSDKIGDFIEKQKEYLRAQKKSHEYINTLKNEEESEMNLKINLSNSKGKSKQIKFNLETHNKHLN